MELVGGQKGCGGCHKIGVKSEEQILELKAMGSTFGHATWDSLAIRTNGLAPYPDESEQWWADRVTILQKPENCAYAFPDLLTFHDAPTPIENRLFEMHLKHRMRAFQGAFHQNPDYSLWYGWSEMIRDLDEIRAMAKEMRTHHKPG